MKYSLFLGLLALFFITVVTIFPIPRVYAGSNSPAANTTIHTGDTTSTTNITTTQNINYFKLGCSCTPTPNQSTPTPTLAIITTVTPTQLGVTPTSSAGGNNAGSSGSSSPGNVASAAQSTSNSVSPSSSSSSGSGSPQQAVIGTMASTGTFTQNLMNTLAILGISLIAVATYRLKSNLT